MKTHYLQRALSAIDAGADAFTAMEIMRAGQKQEREKQQQRKQWRIAIRQRRKSGKM